MSDETGQLQALLDRAAIQELLARYAQAVDRRDLHAVEACFTPTARYHGSLGEGGIRLVLDALAERMRGYSSTMHLLGSQTVALHGDTARSEAYAIVHHRVRRDEEHGDFVAGIRYVDHVVRAGESWLIDERQTSIEWQRYDPVLAEGPSD
jgi:3-phenylpropionate/cinnamic acid dioxygenase small subunit